MTLRLAVLSTGRQDWGILRSTLRALQEDRAFDVRLLAGGMHCSARYGNTIEIVKAAGFAPAETLTWISDEAPSVQQETGRALAAVGEALERQQPEALFLVGDRSETAAAAIAATLASVPIVHLHGGEESEGAFDNNFRHAITKLSHLHLVSHIVHKDRVVAMGEDPSTVHVVGAPGLDNLHRDDLASREELEEALGLPLRAPVVAVTLHPATLGGDPAAEASAVAAAMDAVEATYVVTMPNADPGNEAVREILQRAAAGGPAGRRRAVEALGERRYWGLLRLADAVLGNSSSGLIEAPVVGLPAVNVGDRQRGRLRGENVIDTPAEATSLAGALRRALEPAFHEKARRAPSPFGDGHSATRIREILAGWTPPRPPVKRAVMVSAR